MRRLGGWLFAVGFLVVMAGCGSKEDPTEACESEPCSETPTTDFSLQHVYPDAYEVGQGGPVMLYGEGFEEGMEIALGGRVVTSRFLSGRQIEMTVPEDLPVGAHAVEVRRADEVATLQDGFRVGGWVATRSRQGTFVALVWVDAEVVLAVGGGQQLFRSTDAGVTWREVAPGGRHCDVRQLRRFGTGIHVATSCGLFIDEGAGEVWRRLEGPSDVAAVEVTSDGVIAVVADGSIQRSENGGETWTEHVELGGADVRSLLVLTQDGATRVLTWGAQGVQEWSAEGPSVIVEGRILDADRSPAQGGFAVIAQGDGKLSRTLDGGASWEPLSVSAGEIYWTLFDATGCLWVAASGEITPHRTCEPEGEAPTWDPVDTLAQEVVGVGPEGRLLSSDGFRLHLGVGLDSELIGEGLPYVPAEEISVEPQATGRLQVRGPESFILSHDGGDTWAPGVGCIGRRLMTFERDTGLWAPRLIGYMESTGSISLGEGDGGLCQTWTLGDIRLEGFSSSRLDRGRFIAWADVSYLGGATLMVTETETQSWSPRQLPDVAEVASVHLVVRDGEDWSCATLVREGAGGGAPTLECRHYDGGNEDWIQVGAEGVSVVASQRLAADADRLWLRQGEAILYTDDLATLVPVELPAHARSFHVDGDALLVSTARVEGEHVLQEAFISTDGGATWTSRGVLPSVPDGSLHLTASGGLLWASRVGLYRAGPAITQ